MQTITLEIRKAEVLDILRNLEKLNLVKLIDNNVNGETETTSKEQLIEEIKEAVEEFKLIRAGKKQARNAEDFLNEL